MRFTVTRLLPLLTAAAMLGGCGGSSGSAALPRSPDVTSITPAARTVQDRGHARISCGTDADDCKKIRLVAPLHIAPARPTDIAPRTIDSAGPPSGGVLSLTNTECKHASVYVDADDGLPLAPETFASASAHLAPFQVLAIADPCRHRRAREYYIVSMLQGADGSITVSTIDGPSTESSGTLTFTSPLRVQLQAGTYAFYLATIRKDPDDGGHHGHDGDGDHGDRD